MDGWNQNLDNWETTNINYNLDSVKYDLIIVLAGGLDDNGNVHEWVKRRLNRASELHKTHNIPILCCGGGTYHKKPFTNEHGFVVHESTECVNYLIQKGVSPDNIYREWSSYDTIANAFFAFTTHILCREDWTNIIIITSEFHIMRTKGIFDWIFRFKNGLTLTYDSVSDFGLNPSMISSRTERETQSYLNIIRLREKITTLYDFHEWLFKEHNAYNNKPIVRDNICENTKKSY